MKREFPFWIRARHNPQLGVYYVACGRMSKTAARKYESGTLYGCNVMLRFDTEDVYKARLAELRAAGESVQ